MLCGSFTHHCFCKYHQWTHLHSQTDHVYYYIHSFDLTNSLKRSRTPMDTQIMLWELLPYTPFWESSYSATSQRNFAPSFVSSFNSYKLDYSTYILLYIVHYIISLSPKTDSSFRAETISDLSLNAQSLTDQGHSKCLVNICWMNKQVTCMADCIF